MVCAGICGGRIVLWEYLAKVWNGAAASQLYRTAIIKTMRKEKGEKRKYLTFEDNDPTGYKSSLGKKAKVETFWACRAPNGVHHLARSVGRNFSKWLGRSVRGAGGRLRRCAGRLYRILLPFVLKSKGLRSF